MTTIRPPSVRADRLIRLAFLAFLGLTCVKVWVGPPPLETPVYGQIPDAAAQRKQAIDEAKLTNQLLADIKRILETQSLNVRIQGADNKSSPPNAAGSGS